MMKAFIFFIASMAVVRLQFLLFGDVVALDPVFLSGFYAALAVPPPACIWLAAFIGLTGDWMVGYPLGLQGLALVGVAYLASRARKYILIISWAHFALLTLGLLMVQFLVVHGANLLLRLHLITAFRPLDVLTYGFTWLVGTALAYLHEKRNRL